MTSSGRVGKPVPEQAGGSDNTVSGKDTSNLRTANPYVIMPPHSNYSDPEGPPEVRGGDCPHAIIMMGASTLSIHPF